MAKPLIQMALDSLDFDQTVALAAQVAPYVDILEVGTPCVKHNGLKMIQTLKEKFPNNKVLADLKTMDAGYYEAEPFFKAGADICTVLGVADMGTIKGVIDVANAYGKQAQVDLINVSSKSTVAKEASKLGAHIIGVHTGLDQQAAGQTPFGDLKMVADLGIPVTVSVAGGIKPATIDQVVKSGAGIIVVGAAIYGADNPAEAAKNIRKLVDEASGSCSGGGCGLFGWIKKLFS